MKTIRAIVTITLLLLSVNFLVQCTESKAYESPANYDLSKPLTYALDGKLKEISGISFKPGDDQVLFAIEDEHPRMFRISTEGSILSVSDFGKKGDYEDVSITGSSSFVLRSDGDIFVSSVATGNDPVESKAFENLVPSGEYEGMVAESDSALLVLCKNCKLKKEKGTVTAYKIRVSGGNLDSIAEPVKFDISSLDPSFGDRKISASGIAINPVTRQWYILSSVNKLLIVVEPGMKSSKAFPLNPAIFPQPEGICFDSKGNLFISNEGVTGSATLMRFNRK